MKMNSYRTRAKRVSLLCKYIALSDREMSFQRLESDLTDASRAWLRESIHFLQSRLDEAIRGMETFAQEHTVLYDMTQGLDNPVFDLYKLKVGYKEDFRRFIKILFVKRMVLEIGRESKVTIEDKEKVEDKEKAIFKTFKGYRDAIDRDFFSRVSSSELVPKIDTDLDSVSSSVEIPKSSIEVLKSRCSKVYELRQYLENDLKALQDRVERPLFDAHSFEYTGPVTVNGDLGLQTLPDGDCGLHVVTFAILDPGNRLTNKDLSDLELLLKLEKDDLIKLREKYRSIFLYAMSQEDKRFLVEIQQFLAPVLRWAMVENMSRGHREIHCRRYLPYVEGEVDRLKRKYLGQKVQEREIVTEGFPESVQRELISTAKELAANEILLLSHKNEAVLNELHTWWRSDSGGYEAYCSSLAKNYTYLQPLDLNVLAKSLGFRGFYTKADGKTLVKEEGGTVTAEVLDNHLLNKHLRALRDTGLINGSDNIIARQSEADLERLPEKIQLYYTEKGQTGLEESECRALMCHVRALHASAFRDKEKPLIQAHFSGDHWTYIRQLNSGPSDRL